jgi:hypothetical protein
VTRFLSTKDGASIEPALVQAMKDYDAAQLHGDRAELERLVAPDYLIVRPAGLGDRASLIRNVAGTGIKTDPFMIVQPFTRNFGGTVITGGWCDLHGTDNGKYWEQKTRFADVWTKREGRWWVVMTTLTPSEHP